jgi:uroporphyrinogen decarboxylase
MIEHVKATHPNTPLTLYANGSGGLLERLGATGADVVGLDWTVDMADARQRLGSKSVQVRDSGPAFPGLGFQVVFLHGLRYYL